MKKIKLKDYTGEMVCYINDFGNLEIVDADDVDYIKELSSRVKSFMELLKKKFLKILIGI